MTYREAWEAIYFRHCQETCDYAYMDNCQEEKCEYYMALQALNRQYYAECGSIWTKPTADCKTENSSEIPNNCEGEPTWEQVKEYCNKRCLDIVDSAMRKQWYKDEPQTVDLGNGFSITANGTKTPNYCDNCKDWICEWCTYGQPNDELQTERSE